MIDERHNLYIQTTTYRIPLLCRCAAASPQGVLRTQQTIAKLQAVQPPHDGSPAPVLVYFSTLLEQGKLNKYETLELCRPVIAQQKKVISDYLISDN